MSLIIFLYFIGTYLGCNVGKENKKMKTQQSKNLYKVMQRFADLTSKFILEGNINRAARCFKIADKLMTTGNIIIKNAVSNVYVYSLSLILDKRDEHYDEVMNVLPFSLKKEYENQSIGYGI